MSIEPRLHRTVAAQPYPLLFATISPDKRHRGKLSASLRVSVAGLLQSDRWLGSATQSRWPFQSPDLGRAAFPVSVLGTRRPEWEKRGRFQISHRERFDKS